jgi:hypothetical protein
MRPEAKLEAEVIAWARAQGILCLKLNLMGNTGWPDRVFLHKGRVAFIEFKAPGRPCAPERNQLARIEELKGREFDVGIFNSSNTARTFLAAALLSEEGRKVGRIPSMPGASLRPRHGEDDNVLCNSIDPLKAESHKVRARYSAATSSLQRMAQAVQGVEGIRAFEDWGTSRPAERKRTRSR